MFARRLAKMAEVWPCFGLLVNERSRVGGTIAAAVPPGDDAGDAEREGEGERHQAAGEPACGGFNADNLWLGGDEHRRGLKLAKTRGVARPIRPDLEEHAVGADQLMDVLAFGQLRRQIADDQCRGEAVAKDRILFTGRILAEANAGIIQRQEKVNLIIVLDAKATADIGVVDCNSGDPTSDALDRHYVAKIFGWFFEERYDVK